MEQPCIIPMPWCAIYVAIIARPAFNPHLDFSNVLKSSLQLPTVIKSVQDLFFLQNSKKVCFQNETAYYKTKQVINFKNTSIQLPFIKQVLVFFGFMQYKVLQNVLLSSVKFISIKPINNLCFKQYNTLIV